MVMVLVLAVLALFAAWEACLMVRTALRARAAERAEREWAEACEQWPWRVAAVRDGGPLMLLLGDEVLRLWWDALTPEERAREMAANEGIEVRHG